MTSGDCVLGPSWPLISNCRPGPSPSEWKHLASEVTQPFEGQGQLDSNETKVTGSRPEGMGGALWPRQGPAMGQGRGEVGKQGLPSSPAQGQLRRASAGAGLHLDLRISWVTEKSAGHRVLPGSSALPRRALPHRGPTVCGCPRARLHTSSCLCLQPTSPCSVFVSSFHA